MHQEIEKKNTAIDLLKNYDGINTYLLALKRDIITYKKVDKLTDFNVDYILKNINYQIKDINKIVRVIDWYGDELKDKWETDFRIEKVLIKKLLGETDKFYHCFIQYRKNVEPSYAFLKKNGIIGNFLLEDYHNISIDFDRYDKLSMSRTPDKPRKIKNHQKEAVQFLISRKKCILADDMGLGKMEPVSSLIPTPEGFKKMGDIKVGDYIFGNDGKPHKVLKIFPHKNKEIYRVNFSDNTFAECGLEHLWVVRDSNMRIRNKGWKIMSLKEIIDSGISYKDEKRKEKGLNPRSKYEIPITEAVEYTEKQYFIHPYILGYCIGDGNMCGSSINISIPDFEKESVSRLFSYLNESYMLNEDRSTNCPRYRIIKRNKDGKNEYLQEIRKLGLNVKGNYKFIPEFYKLGSIRQRLDLLRGLMDSDGTIQKGNKIIFNTVSETLANDIKELVFSLGGIARIHSYDRRKQGKNIEYYVNIQIKENPFYLTRKAEKYNPTFKKYCTKHIVSAEYVRNEDAQCIYVDSEEHTYLTGKSYIVTHNTTSLTVASIEGNFDAILIICPASLKSNWLNELTNYVSEKDISIIGGVNEMKKNEIEKYLGYGEGKSGKNLNELKEEAKERGKWTDNRYVIINFDILDDVYKVSRAKTKEGIEKAMENSPMLKFLLNKKSLIIIDEAHKLSNNTSDRYKIIKDLINKSNPHSIYLSTGTPITNDPANYFNLLSLLNDPLTIDREFYYMRYCDAFKMPINEQQKQKKQQLTQEFLNSHNKNTWYDLTVEEKKSLNDIINKRVIQKIIPKGGKNLEELKMQTAHVYLRRTKDDIGDLPPKYIHERVFELNKEQMAEYKKLWDEYEAAKLEEDSSKELNKELIEGGIYRKYLSNQMVPNTIKLAEKCLAKGEKIVIACCYDDELYTLRDYFKDKCVIYNGKMSLKEKDEAIKKFNSDPNVMIFIGNIIAAGVGITLTSSRVVIFNNFSYVPGDNSQFQDRVHRIGQTRDVHIFYQFFKDTQYEKMWNTVLSKSLIINQVIKKEDEK